MHAWLGYRVEKIELGFAILLGHCIIALDFHNSENGSRLCGIL
jgi:hypothetical protein